MTDELADLLDSALYKEIAAQALYTATQDKTEDPGARALLRDLAEEEQQHALWLKKLKEEGTAKGSWHPEKVADLKISQHLSGPDNIEGAGLQETLIFAMKQEQQAIEFYSRMMSALRDQEAKSVCQNLVQEELRHKLKLETYYDDLFYGED